MCANKSLPKVVIVPTGGTIQNTEPFVTSSKAGGTLNVRRPQRLYAPATVKIAKEDVDGKALPIRSNEDPFWSVTLKPEDGLYLLPYMEPGHEPPSKYTGVYLGVRRLIEEIDNFGLDDRGRNNLLKNTANLVINEIIDPRTGRELRVNGATFTVFELVLIANAVNEALADRDAVGCVVTQGTFTAEETACFLNYVVNSDKPVVVCASQRRHMSISNDGDRNLVDAVRVAIHPESRGKGVMLVMNEEILPAREVTKTNQRPDGFVSSGGSSRTMGTIEEDQVTFYYQPVRKHTLKSDVRSEKPLPHMLPSVDIVKTYAGADGVLVEALIDRALKERSGASDSPKHGIVVEGFAYSGKPHTFQVAALEKAVTKYGIPVALANRGDYGRIPSAAHGGLFITCDNFMAVKARLLLTLAIEKFGMLTPYDNPDKPTVQERTKLHSEVQAYQIIFDTH